MKNKGFNPNIIMPRIQKIFDLDVTPESFLNACSPEELIELSMLLFSSRFQTKIDIHTKQKIKQIESFKD